MQMFFQSGWRPFGRITHPPTHTRTHTHTHKTHSPPPHTHTKHTSLPPPQPSSLPPPHIHTHIHIHTHTHTHTHTHLIERKNLITSQKAQHTLEVILKVTLDNTRSRAQRV